MLNKAANDHWCFINMGIISLVSSAVSDSHPETGIGLLSFYQQVTMTIGKLRSPNKSRNTHHTSPPQISACWKLSTHSTSSARDSTLKWLIRAYLHWLPQCKRVVRWLVIGQPWYPQQGSAQKQIYLRIVVVLGVQGNFYRLYCVQWIIFTLRSSSSSVFLSVFSPRTHLQRIVTNTNVGHKWDKCVRGSTET